MFKTIENDGEADITEKKSKFIANVFYIKSITEAEEKIRWKIWQRISLSR